MATPLARLPVSNTRNLPVALELLRENGASTDELGALTAAGSRVELAWASSTRPEWMIRLAWLLGADRRALVALLAEALREAGAGSPLPPSLGEAIAGLSAWTTGEVETAALLELLEPLAELASGEPEARRPSGRTLLGRAGQLMIRAADLAEQADLKRWHLARVGASAAAAEAGEPFGRLAEQTVPATPTLPALLHEGAAHAAEALRLCCDAVQAKGAAAGSPDRLRAEPLPWTPRAIAARQAADALRQVLSAGALLRRLSAAALSPSVNWID